MKRSSSTRSRRGIVAASAVGVVGLALLGGPLFVTSASALEPSSVATTSSDPSPVDSSAAPSDSASPVDSSPAGTDSAAPSTSESASPVDSMTPTDSSSPVDSSPAPSDPGNTGSPQGSGDPTTPSGDPTTSIPTSGDPGDPGSPTDPGLPSTGGNGATLPKTGTETAALAALAGGLIAVGTLSIVAGRRRTEVDAD